MADPKLSTARAFLSLTAIAVVAAILVTGSHELSFDRIQENRQARLLETLHQVLDPASHDNDLTQSRQSVRDVELLGSEEPVDVFIATENGRAVAAIFSSVARRGYNGPIRLLVGITASGHVTGVRVTEHRETPGLGDIIEIEKSSWIRVFDGANFNSRPPEDWAVRQDGGQFDAVTGATVTPRAVINGVKNTLIYFQRHKDTLFSAHSSNRSQITGERGD
jgi:Na+-translocating ferredoxin:NAD+ oxidoreductase subunit G